MNRFPERQSTVDEGEISSEAGDRNVSRRDFLKVAAGVVGALALGSATLEGLSGCSSNTANATSDSETTANQSAESSANANTSDEIATANKIVSALTNAGFQVTSDVNSIPQHDGGYVVDVTLDGYKGEITSNGDGDYNLEMDSPVNYNDSARKLSYLVNGARSAEPKK